MYVLLSLFLVLTAEMCNGQQVTMEGEAEPLFIVMTFNTGTGAMITASVEDNLGYGREQAKISDKYYGNGLAWKTAVQAVRDFVHEVLPDIVAFQEMFYCGDCEMIPEEARKGFICEDWIPGARSVVQFILGEDYQIASHKNSIVMTNILLSTSVSGILGDIPTIFVWVD